LNTGHLSILRDHSLDNRVHLFFFPQVLGFGLCFQLFVQFDLAVDLLLVLQAVGQTSCFGLSLDLVLDLFGPKHDLVDLSVLLLSISHKSVK
jgi:hypothetical protein